MLIATILGARPQFIKAAVVTRALNDLQKRLGDLTEIYVHTGQHYSPGMSDVFFETLELPQPKYHLGIGSGQQGEQTGRMLEAVEKVLVAERPDVVLIYGDTNSTLAGALAAAKLHIPVAHVEAGLRSYNRRMPEEINRIIADQLSSLLFAPTQTALANLASEGIRKGVFLVGDVMYDAAQRFASKARPVRPPLEVGRFFIATVHRAENTDDPNRLKRVLSLLSTVQRFAQFRVLLPLHPRTKQRLKDWNLSIPSGIDVSDPVDYFDMLGLLRDCAIVLTDSGGVQKEAFFLKRPCITLRDETEWIETVEAGWNTIVGVDADAACLAVRRYLDAPPPPTTGTPFGDGQASRRIAEILCDLKRLA